MSELRLYDGLSVATRSYCHLGIQQYIDSWPFLQLCDFNRHLAAVCTNKWLKNYRQLFSRMPSKGNKLQIFYFSAVSYLFQEQHFYSQPWCMLLKFIQRKQMYFFRLNVGIQMWLVSCFYSTKNFSEWKISTYAEHLNESYIV